MNKYVLTALLCPFVGSSLQARPGEPSAPAGNPIRVGGYEACPTDSQLALEARAFIQKNLSALTITEVAGAYIQLVAGLNVKLVCRVKGEDGPSEWQFVAYQSLDHTWHLYAAERI